MAPEAYAHAAPPPTAADMPATAEDEGQVPSRDGTPLSRRSYRPAAGPAWARLALLHGYGDHAGRYAHFLRWLAGRGVAGHSFDFRGHGRSPGRRGYVRRWDEFLDDALGFLDWVAGRAGDDGGGPLFVLGHSHGGLVTAVAGERGLLDPYRVAGCVLCAPYVRGLTPVPWYKRAAGRVCNRVAPWLALPTGLREGSMSADEAMCRESRADPLIHRVATPRWYHATLAVQAEALARAGDFRLSLLCFVGDEDRVADPAAGRAFFAAAGSADKQLVEYPDGRHELLRDVGREGTFAAIDGWVRARALCPPAGPG